MDEVVLEVLNAGGVWVKVGGVGEAEPPGSFSSHSDGRRQVLMFGWYEGDGPGVWRSRGGIDLETPAVREIVAIEGLEKLADLTEGPYRTVAVVKQRPHNVRLSLVPGA